MLFEYLQTTDTEITVGKLKDTLRSIERQDVIDVLEECEKSEYNVPLYHHPHYISSWCIRAFNHVIVKTLQ